MIRIILLTLCVLLSKFQIATAQRCQIEWKVQEALDAQSDWGYCATKAKADREQRKIEARGQQATFIIVEDPVYCETKAPYCLIDKIPCYNGFESSCLDEGMQCRATPGTTGEIGKNGEHGICPERTSGCCNGDVFRTNRAPNKALDSFLEDNEGTFEVDPLALSPESFEMTNPLVGFSEGNDGMFQVNPLAQMPGLFEGTDSLIGSSAQDSQLTSFQLSDSPGTENLLVDGLAQLPQDSENPSYDLFSPSDPLEDHIASSSPSWQQFVA